MGITMTLKVTWNAKIGREKDEELNFLPHTFQNSSLAIFYGFPCSRADARSIAEDT